LELPKAIDHEGIGVMVEFIHTNIGPFLPEEKPCLLAFSDKFLDEIMSTPGFQPMPIGRTGSGFAFQENIQVAKGAGE
jgi:hypothetical protein